MRIDDNNRISYMHANQTVKRSETNGEPGEPPSSNGPSSDVSRAERLDKLKKAMSDGRPVDAGKLADKLLDSGIFFDERA